MQSKIAAIGAPLAILFTLQGAPALADNAGKTIVIEVDAAALAKCMTYNDAMLNFIATRTLVPKPSMDQSRLYRSSSGTLSDAVVSADGLANPIILQVGKSYFEFRSDGLQEQSSKAQLMAMCAIDPKLDLPAQFKAQVMASLSPPESLIDIDTRDAVSRRDLRHKYQDGGAVDIPSYIDRPKAP
jgi:hypothetical protein